MLGAVTEWDFSVLYWIQQNLRTDFLDCVAVIFNDVFNAGIFWIALGVLFLFFRKTRAGGVMLLCSMVTALLVGELCMKNIICRPRPCHIDMTIPMAVKVPTSYSFPSGHTGSSFASAGALFAFNKKIGIPALVLAVMVAFSRLYLFVHYPTDVIAGALLGLLCAFVTALIFKRFSFRSKIENLGRVRSA